MVKNDVQMGIKLIYYHLVLVVTEACRSQWPRGLRRRSAAARLLRWWVQILPEACMLML